MIKEQIKKANIQAMKDKNQNARALFSVVLNKIMLEEVKLRGTGKELNDGDILNILQKTMKELDEEKAGFEKAQNTERVDSITAQQALLKEFLPQMMTEDEIKNIVLSLEDKSIGSVMKHFKMNYNGKCDMGLVKKVIDGLK